MFECTDLKWGTLVIHLKVGCLGMMENGKGIPGYGANAGIQSTGI